jgi:uncharacterized protein (TIGR00251 family)
MYITVDVKTNQHKDCIKLLNEKHYIVQVKAQARKGNANKVVAKLLRNHFSKEVLLLSGHTSNRKFFEIKE